MKEVKNVALLGQLGGEMPLQTGRTDDLQGPDSRFVLQLLSFLSVTVLKVAPSFLGRIQHISIATRISHKKAISSNPKALTSSIRSSRLFPPCLYLVLEPWRQTRDPGLSDS